MTFCKIIEFADGKPETDLYCVEFKDKTDFKLMYLNFNGLSIYKSSLANYRFYSNRNFKFALSSRKVFRKVERLFEFERSADLSKKIEEMFPEEFL